MLSHLYIFAYVNRQTVLPTFCLRFVYAENLLRTAFFSLLMANPSARTATAHAKVNVVC